MTTDKPRSRRPLLRAQYATPIRKFVERANVDVTDKWEVNTARFLLKLADFLESEGYAAKSAKALRLTRAWKAKKAESTQ